MTFLAGLGALQLAVLVVGRSAETADARKPVFELVQPDLFGAPGGQPNAWADFDGDGDLDLFVGFRDRPNRLYRNEGGRFVDVAAEAGLADALDTRAAAWGDFDADGDPDLYVGWAAAGEVPNRIYRNDGGRFTDATKRLGVDLRGASRQPAWIDYDQDGDLDLFAAFRDRPNRLFRNQGDRFVDVSRESGVDDPRKTVGAVWWDFDRDGDLDLFVANQEGDANGLFVNDRGRFTDRAQALGVDGVTLHPGGEASQPGREGGVGPAVADFDLDGDIDLFVANYGPSALYRDDGIRFVDVAKLSGIVGQGHVTTSAWGDYDNDGRPDLYLGAYLREEPHYRDFLFHNDGQGEARVWRFSDRLPELLLTHDATHGVQWADFDGDGRLDLALTNNDAKGGHWLLRNAGADSPAALQAQVTDARGRLTKAGAEVRAYAAGTRRLIAAAIVDTGSGYCSQNAAPVHLGLGPSVRIDLEVTTFARGGRNVARKPGIDPAAWRGKTFVVRVE